MNNNGNLNNNNKYIGFTAVPVAELVNINRMEKKSGYRVPLGDIWDAYYMCIKNKRRTMNAMLFNANLEKNITRLWKDINDRTYTIGRSIAFIVEHPVKREVFAADFRDRIVHDYVCMRLNPLIEDCLPDNMTSNRKGKGTLYAIRRVADNIYQCSEGYTKDCWVWKFDLQGFFMSIDKRLLNDKLQTFIDERYFCKDKDVVKWLTEMIIMNCPQKNCLRKSRPQAWEGLRSDKSLFSQDDYHGVPIGNLPSQIFANFFLREMVLFLISNGFDYNTQYVDDNVVVSESKAKILTFIPALRTWLIKNLGITLHPRKCYIQHYSKGVSFVGGIIKPRLIYVSKRTRRKMLGKVHWLISQESPDMKDVLASVNSYFGQTAHFSGFRLRLKCARMLFGRFGNAIMFNSNCQKLILL